jgi:tRNA threonylcarbamoyladenosine biosynthesis protein TsaB
VAVRSLDALAFPHRATGRPVAAIVDARRGEVFFRLYRPGGAAATDPQVLAPADVQAPKDALLVGDGARRYADLLAPAEIAGPDHAHPGADVVARFAMEEGQPISPSAVVPEYLRHADVRIGWAQRQPAKAAHG